MVDYALRCPEVNSALMYTGPGAGSMLAAAAAWNTTGTQLESAASGYFSEISGLAGQMWFGPSSMRMAAAATPYIAWLHASAAQAFQTSAQTYAVAAAYETAYAMTVPPWAIAANRAQLMALVATNFFGQNTPAIAACEAQYMAYWAQDAAVMYCYAADSSAASNLTPFNQPPRTTTEGASAQTRALAQTAGNTARARTQVAMQQLSSTGTTVDPLLPTGSTLNVAPGATIDPGVTVTVSNGYPVTVTGSIEIVNPTTSVMYTLNGIPQADLGISASMQHLVVPAGAEVNIVGGTFTYVSGSPITIPSGGIVGATSSIGGAEVMVNVATGAVTEVTGGAITTGPALVPVAPVASGSSAALAAAPAAGVVSGAPGLAGTAAIQPQLSVEGLAEWARTIFGADIAAQAAAGIAG